MTNTHNAQDIQIQHWNNFPIPVETNEHGFWNLTAMSKPYGKNKQVSNFLRSKEAQEFIAALEQHQKLTDPEKLRNDDTERDSIRSSISRNDDLLSVLIVNQGGISEFQGTWGHRYLAIRFAMWLDPIFAIWVVSLVEKLIAQSSVTSAEELSRLQSMLDEYCDRESEYNSAMASLGKQIEEMTEQVSKLEDENEQLNVELVLTSHRRNQLLYHLDSAREIASSKHGMSWKENWTIEEMLPDADKD